MTYHVKITQSVRRSSVPPTFTSPYQDITICPRLPVQPEFRPDPPRSHPSHPRFDFLVTPPTSHPRAVIVSSPTRHHVSEIEHDLAYVRIGHHSRSSSITSSNRSASPPSTRSISPCSSLSRSSSTNSQRSVRFDDVPQYFHPEKRVTEKDWEYVSSRGMAYHRTEFRGRSGHSERKYSDRETLVVEKVRRGGRERKKRQESERESRYW